MAYGALQQILLINSSLDEIHAQGLSACTGLKQFGFYGTQCAATNYLQHLNVRAGLVTVLPETSPALHQLTRLEFKLCSQVPGSAPLSLNLFSILTALPHWGLMITCDVEKGVFLDSRPNDEGTAVFDVSYGAVSTCCDMQSPFRTSD